MYYLCITIIKDDTIMELIIKIIWAIVGGAISIAFVVGGTCALCYMAYYLMRYGWKRFVVEFYYSRP
jgi:hypothetical protein